MLHRCVAWSAAWFWRSAGDWPLLRPALTRAAAHAAVILVALVTAGLSQVEWPAHTAPVYSFQGFAVPFAEAETAGDLPQLMPLQTVSYGSALPSAPGVPVTRQALIHTNVPERPRPGIMTYTVQAGDTIEDIALGFHLDPTTLMWSNPAIEDAPDLLRIGQALRVLPVDGVYHMVTEEDTLASIAETYSVDVAAITDCAYNYLVAPDFPILPGMGLIVPGGQKPYHRRLVTTYEGPVPEGVRGSGQLEWPAWGLLTQGYWYGHRAIDLGLPEGSALLAADDGYVSFAGWTDVGYGYLIVIDHANGYQTYYAHLSNIFVAVGQAVARGQVVAASGNTGWSTGPHLHFEVRYNGVQQNPLVYLP